jgi:hypothetical protein
MKHNKWQMNRQTENAQQAQENLPAADCPLPFPNTPWVKNNKAENVNEARTGENSRKRDEYPMW